MLKSEIYGSQIAGNHLTFFLKKNETYVLRNVSHIKERNETTTDVISQLGKTLHFKSDSGQRKLVTTKLEVCQQHNSILTENTYITND